MPRSARILQTVHVVVLGLWLGSLVMTGVAAAIIFPTLRDLKITSPLYAAYTGEQWRLLAGHPAAKIFAINDMIQFASFFVAIATLAGLYLAWPAARRTRQLSLRFSSLVLAMGLLAYQLFVLSPRMDVNLRTYWSAAERGAITEASAAQQAFDEDHPVATKVLGGSTLLVLLALALAAWPMTPAGETSATPARTKPTREPPFETPLLSR